MGDWEEEEKTEAEERLFGGGRDAVGVNRIFSFYSNLQDNAYL
mgnify:CR=1 FL=1